MFVRLYGEIIPEPSEGIIDRTGAQTMLYHLYHDIQYRPCMLRSISC